MIPSHPWDEQDLRSRLLHAVAGLPRYPLPELQAPRTPATYLMFLDAPALAPMLGVACSVGVLPFYSGSCAVNSHSRLSRYRQSLDGVGDLDAEDVWVAVLPMPGTASALFAEQILIDTFAPPLNNSGWGARAPGAGRPGRRCSTIDALLPGRRWATRAGDVDVALAHAKVVGALARRPSDAPRWPPLHTEAR